MNRTSYCRGDELYTRWAEVDGLTAFSFLAMGRVGGDDSDWERALIIGFAASGEFTFTHLPRDCLLEARLYGVEGEVLHRSAPFEVDCSGPEASIAADRDVYAAGDPITFEWEDADGWALDWIGVYPAEAPPDAYVAFAYTDPLFSGPYAGSLTWEDMTFMAEDPLPPGEYEVRLMEDNGFVVQATGRFTVE